MENSKIRAGIAEMYKSLEEMARKEGEDEKAELLRQQQKDITRYLLNTLTRQLESSIQSDLSPGNQFPVSNVQAG